MSLSPELKICCIAEAIDGKLEYAVDYDDTRFNSISIDEVFEVED